MLTNMKVSSVRRPNERHLAEQMAELTLSLLDACQEKQERIAFYHGLSVAEFRLFRKFKDDGVVSPGELARRMHISNSRITRILDGMVAKHIVTRETAKDDRRVVEVALTSHGKEILAELNDDYVNAHRDIMSMLPPDASEAVVDALEKLDHAMAEWVTRAGSGQEQPSGGS